MPQVSALCDGVPVHTPEDSCHEGCPVLTKTRHVVIPKGAVACIDWPMRFPTGTGMDLSNCFPSEASISISESEAGTSKEVRVRFAACDVSSNTLEVEGEIVEDAAAQGRVRANVPPAVYQEAGIYQMQFGIVDPGENGAADTVFAIDGGLLSVEGTLWGDTRQAVQPPTLNDIRMHLRDTPIENDLLADYEFDNDEVINALVRPIRQWNETPPPIAVHTCRSFPYRYYWLQAVVGELLRTAAHHYMRNNLKVQHGGVSGNIKDKYKEYMATAQMYRDEWLIFVDQKKVELNAAAAFGVTQSAYDPWGI